MANLINNQQDTSVILFDNITHRGTAIKMIYTPELGISCYMDNKIQSSEFDEKEYHCALVDPIMQKLKPRSVCIFGGGEGATAREVLKYEYVEHVLMIEWDKDVLELFIRRFPQWAKGAWQDKRLRIEIADAFTVCNDVRQYDVIIVDLFDPADGQSLKWFNFITHIVKWAQLGVAIYCGTRQHDSYTISKSVRFTEDILNKHMTYTTIYSKHIPSFAEVIENNRHIITTDTLLGKYQHREEEDAVFIIGTMQEMTLWENIKHLCCY